MNDLTAEQKATILADFIDWTGGLTPEECTPDLVEDYIHHYATTDAEAAYRAFLLPQQGG